MSESLPAQNTESPAQKSTPNYGESSEQRCLPQLRDWFSAKNVFAWMFGFLERWVFSRKYNRLLAGVPFLAFGVLGPAFVWWLENAPQDHVVQSYEAAVSAAIKSGDAEQSSVFLEGLVKLRPNENRYKFQLALNLIENGQEAKGVTYLRSMSEAGPNGYNPARLWLATQAVGPTPRIPLTVKMQEDLLRLIVATDPMHQVANQMLAELNLKDGNLKEAEDRLLRIVESSPALGLPLAQIQTALNRSPEQIEFHLENSVRHFSNLLLTDPSNIEMRIRCAEAQAFAERFGDAEQILKEGLAQNNAEELRSELSRLYSRMAIRDLQVSVLNRDRSARYLVKAAHLTPAEAQITEQILALARVGAVFSTADLEPSITAYSNIESRSFEDEMQLSQLLAIAGRSEEAIARMAPLVETDIRFKAMKAKHLIATGKPDEAAAALNQVVDNFKNRSEALSTLDIITHAEALILLSQFDEALALLQAAIETNNVRPETNDRNIADSESATQERTLLQTAYGHCCLLAFDNRQKEGSFEDPQQAMQLLEDALRTDSVSIAVLERLAYLSSSGTNLAEAAETALTRMLTAGMGNADIYNMIGTRALNLNNPAQACRYLERAYALTRSNPMVLNNLAVALVRDNPENAERALEIANSALEILKGHRDVLSTRAEVFIALERWDEALRDLEVSLSKGANSRDVRLLLSQVYDALGETTLAEENRRIMEAMEPAPATPKQE